MGANNVKALKEVQAFKRCFDSQTSRALYVDSTL